MKFSNGKIKTSILLHEKDFGLYEQVDERGAKECHNM